MIGARFRLLEPHGCLVAALALSVISAEAHTLPISYLRIQPDADYLHLELMFNPFELTFISEVDDNHDGELNTTELSTHGEVVAKRVVAAMTVSVGGKVLTAETAGMDPELSGHHVRVRAHYKADARRVPITIESGLNSITSSSHLVQVTYTCEGRQRLAQLDAQSRKVTFQPFGTGKGPVLAKRVEMSRVSLGVVLLTGLLLLVVVVTAVLLFVRRQPR